MRDQVFRGAAVLVAGLLLTSACSERPTPQLIDETGMVTEYRFHLTPEDTVGDRDMPVDPAESESGAVVIEPPAGWDIRVAWPANACKKAPTVRVTGTSEQVTTIHVDYGPDVAQGACPEELLIFGVDLRTSRPPAPDLAVTGTA